MKDLYRRICWEDYVKLCNKGKTGITLHGRYFSNFYVRFSFTFCFAFLFFLQSLLLLLVVAVGICCVGVDISLGVMVTLAVGHRNLCCVVVSFAISL